jgi:hypothetical protein
MWYIGTSLGRCLKSILEGEVSEEQVLLIVTATNAPTFSNFMDVVNQYYKGGNYFVSDPNQYDASIFSEENYKGLAQRLWEQGKIHQPHNFPEHWGNSNGIRGQTWLQVVPTINNTTPAVVDAYEKYKMLDLLTKNE